MSRDPITIGQAAAEVGIQIWQLRRCCTRGFVDEPKRIRQIRIFDRADIPRLRAAAQAAGYLPEGRNE